MIENHHYILFWYEALLVVLLWIAYAPSRAFFGVYVWVGIVLFFLVGPPLLLLLYWRSKGRI